MFDNDFGVMPASARKTPPSWAVLSVKCCVVGILTFPLAVPLLLAGSVAAGGSDSFQRAAFFSAGGVWLGMFALAQYLTSVYPPVPRR